MSIFNNLRTEKQYKAATGLTPHEFEHLFEYFQKYYRPKKENPFPNTPKPVLTDKKEALFFILHYLKAYPTLENIRHGMGDYILVLKSVRFPAI